jgi:sugar fermentation stimulation protein A
MPDEPLLAIRGVEKGILVERINRFTVAVKETRGGRLNCHLHDPGRLRHILRPGATVYYRNAWRPGRKTPCDIVAVEAGEILVLEDTRIPNKVLPSVLGLVLPGYEVAAREVQVNGMRVDFLASTPSGEIALIEAKATNLVEAGTALFPDAPSRRAHRQLEALAAASTAAEAHVFFTILRPDANRLRPHRRIDPVFARLLCSLRGKISYHAYTLHPVHAGGEILVYMGRVVPVEPC